MMERVFIIGTGLIGASTGLALRAAGFAGRIDGWDASSLEMAAAVQMGAIDGRASNREDALELARLADVIVLAVPVLAIKDWMQQLAPVLRAGQLVTDVGSTKLEIVELARAAVCRRARRRVFCRGIRWRARSRVARCWRRRGCSMGRCGCLRRPRLR